MMLSFFSSSESLHASDDFTKELIKAAATATCLVAVGIAKYGYEWVFPTAEQINSANEARERTAYLAVKTKFRECLIDPIKSKSEKNIDGVPTACEKEVSAFVICGGYHEAIQMTSDFGRTK